MKKITLLIILFNISLSFSQEKIKDINLKIEKKSDVFQVVEESKNQVSLFFNDKKKVQVIRFDKSFSIIDSLSADRPDSNYENIIGYSQNNNKYFAYWANSNNKEIVSQSFDFDLKKVEKKEFHFEFSKEKIIQSTTVNSKFYIITILKNTSILNFYALNNDKLEKKSIDLSSFKFLNNHDKVVSLYDIVSSSTDFEQAYNFQQISNESPASLTFSACKRKVYVFDNDLVFTLDNNRKFTQSFKINLSDFSFSQKNYPQPYVQEEAPNPDETFPSYTISNSFLLKDKIIQMKLSSDVLKILIKNNEGDELKSFTAEYNKDIDFKNSEILQENGSAKSLRVLDKSNQLIRKINNTNPSISCYENNDKYYLTLGGVSLVQQNGMLYGGMIGGFTGALIGAAISSNYSLNNINSYSGRKVVYLNCFFDKNFNHINGDIKKLEFDKLRSFSEENKSYKTRTVFVFNSELVFGGYDTETNKYSFFKFQD